MGILTVLPLAAQTMLASIMIPVLFGILVLAILNETVGWTVERAILPGALAAIFLIQPGEAIIIVMEGVITAGLCRMITARSKQTGAGRTIFENERLLSLLIVAFLVKILTEQVLLPVSAGLLGGETRPLMFGPTGLVLVPLLADRFWHINHRTTTAWIVGATGITAIFLYLLGPFMESGLGVSVFNLSLFEVEYGLGASLPLGTAGTLLMVLIAAFVITMVRPKVSYTGGKEVDIIIPAFIALCWLQPVELFVASIEAMIAIGFVRLVRSWYAGVPFCGGRTLFLVFAVVLGLRFLEEALGVRMYGFNHGSILGIGPLVAPLIAWKLESEGFKLTGRPLILGSALGAMTGLVLCGLVSNIFEREPGTEVAHADRFTDVYEDMQILIAMEGWRVSPPGTENGASIPSNYRLRKVDQDRIRVALTEIQENVVNGGNPIPQLERAAVLLSPIGYQVVRLRDKVTDSTFVYIRETAEAPRGRGMTLVRMVSESEDVVVVPWEGRNQMWIIQTGALIFRELGARAFTVDGVATSAERFNAYHATLSALRKPTFYLRAINGVRAQWSGPPPTKVLLERLRSILGPIDSSTADGPPTLWVPELLSRTVTSRALGSGTVEVDPIASPLLKILEEEAESGQETGILATRSIPTLGEIRFLKDRVIQPLIDIVQKDTLTEGDDDDLVGVSGAASSLGIKLWKTPGAEGEDRIILRANPGSMFQGLAVFRAGEARPMVLALPTANDPRVVASGVLLYQRLGGRCLIVGPRGSNYTIDETSALSYHFQDVFLSLPSERRPFVVTLTGYTPPPMKAGPDVILGVGRERPRGNLPRRLMDLRPEFRELGAIVEIQEGGSLTAVDAPQGAMTDLALKIAPDHYGIVWLSPRYSENLAGGRGHDLSREVSRALGIHERTVPVSEWVLNNLDARRRTTSAMNQRTKSITAKAIAVLKQYIETGHVGYLARLVDLSWEGGGKLTYLRDESTGRGHIVLIPSPGAGWDLIIGTIEPTERVRVDLGGNVTPEQIQAQLLARSGVIVVESVP